MGCGSGILSIAASKLGYAPVRGFDVDPDAVAASQENAAKRTSPGKAKNIDELSDAEFDKLVERVRRREASI